MGIGSKVGSALSKASHKGEAMVGGLLKKPRGPGKPLTKAQDLQALDNTAFKVNGQWTAEFVISIFDRHDEEKAHKAGEEILSLLGVKKGEVRWSRVHYFIAVPRENINVDLRQVGGQITFPVGPTQYNGIMSPEIAIPNEGTNWVQGNQAVFDVMTPPDYPERHNLTTVFAEETGYGVISDIDDTIKISQVLDRMKLLYHTFIEEHGQPVAGMPQLYHSLVTRLSNPTFFYLSASPWQLYLFLLDFVRKNYPFGQIILRDMSYLELSSFVSTLTIGTQEYKEDRMEKIHRWLPHKQFFCIGDSSQKDPEAYGTTYRKYPGWITAIWIRIVEGVNPEKEKDLNAPERFEKAFEGVPRQVWRTFKNPAELMLYRYPRIQGDVVYKL